MAAGENEAEGSSMGSPVGGSLSLAEPVACAGSSSPLLCSDAIPREGQQSEQLCVVCHYFPLSRALLPCRHTCICAICFCEYAMMIANPSRLETSRKNFSARTSVFWWLLSCAKFLTRTSHRTMTCRVALNSPKKLLNQNKIADIPFLPVFLILLLGGDHQMFALEDVSFIYFYTHREYVQQTPMRCALRAFGWRFLWWACFDSLPLSHTLPTAKLDRCPMCRAPISSYFCIRSEEYVPANAETRAPKSKAAINWIDALNDRLTDFLGFR